MHRRECFVMVKNSRWSQDGWLSRRFCDVIVDRKFHTHKKNRSANKNEIQEITIVDEIVGKKQKRGAQAKTRYLETSLKRHKIGEKQETPRIVLFTRRGARVAMIPHLTSRRFYRGHYLRIEEKGRSEQVKE